MSEENEKVNAAGAAIGYLDNHLTIGLGTGTTVKFFLELLGYEISRGLKIRGVPTSKETEMVAKLLAIPLVQVEQVDRIHLTVDGADEINREGNLLKGGGGALLREKIIANASDQLIIIADPSKQVEYLGEFPLPVEVSTFGFTITAKKIYDVLTDHGIDNPQIKQRLDDLGEPFKSDGGNYILDCHCQKIYNESVLAERLASIPGVIEHGLFLNLTRTVIIGNETGVKIFEI